MFNAIGDGIAIGTAMKLITSRTDKKKPSLVKDLMRDPDIMDIHISKEDDEIVIRIKKKPE